MPDYADIVKRLRGVTTERYPGFTNLYCEAATAIETLLAQRKLLVAEVEAASRMFNSLGGIKIDLYIPRATGDGPLHQITLEESVAAKPYIAARAARTAAFPGGLTK